MAEHTRSLWMETEVAREYPRLSGDLTVDVVVVGAGITGITAAALLKASGRRVALVEARRVFDGETGHTTAHITELLDEGYHVLRSRFGRRGIQLAAQSVRQAIEHIAARVERDGIRCGFSRVPAYLYTEQPQDESELEKEVEAAREAGLVASLTRKVPLPFARLALKLDNQAQFHPLQYLRPLLDSIPGDGSHVFELTRVLDVHDGKPCVVETDAGTITAHDVFVAANVPINNKFFLHTKLEPYRTYAIALPWPSGFPAGLFWDTYDPYHYTRIQQTPEGDYLIVGGEDHKVGTDPDAAAAFARLEQYVHSRFGSGEVAYRWSGQIIEPIDGLAFIGRNSGSRHVYVASGYSGTGMTFGTIAAVIVSDLIQERPNPFAELYDATRIKPLAQAKDFISYNAGYPMHFMADRLKPADAAELAAVGPEEGKVVALNGRKLAVYRDATGALHTLSPVCPHMGCHVRWNSAELSWDCPCHGGRFDGSGKVLNGPPVQDLAKEDLEGEERQHVEPPPDDAHA